RVRAAVGPDLPHVPGAGDARAPDREGLSQRREDGVRLVPQRVEGVGRPDRGAGGARAPAWSGGAVHPARLAEGNGVALQESGPRRREPRDPVRDRCGRDARGQGGAAGEGRMLDRARDLRGHARAVPPATTPDGRSPCRRPARPATLVDTRWAVTTTACARTPRVRRPVCRLLASIPETLTLPPRGPDRTGRRAEA